MALRVCSLVYGMPDLLTGRLYAHRALEGQPPTRNQRVSKLPVDDVPEVPG